MKTDLDGFVDIEAWLKDETASMARSSDIINTSPRNRDGIFSFDKLWGLRPPIRGSRCVRVGAIDISENYAAQGLEYLNGGL